MSELKPCEAIEILENGDWWNWLSQEFDPESEPSTDLHSALDAAISALRRAQPANEPLTSGEGAESMTDEEAIKEFNSLMNYIGAHPAKAKDGDWEVQDACILAISALRDRIAREEAEAALEASPHV